MYELLVSHDAGISYDAIFEAPPFQMYCIGRRNLPLKDFVGA